MMPAEFAGRRHRRRASRARRVAAVCLTLAASVVLSADSCDREDNGAILGPGVTSAAGRYGLTTVVRAGTDSLAVPLTFTAGGSTYVLSGATLSLTGTGAAGQNSTFTISVNGTQNGLATAMGIPGAGTWTQSGSTITFAGVDGSTFTGTLTNNVLRVSPITIEARGASALRFTRL